MNGAWDMINGSKWSRIWLPASFLSLINFGSAQSVSCTWLTFGLSPSGPWWLTEMKKVWTYDFILFSDDCWKQRLGVFLYILHIKPFKVTGFFFLKSQLGIGFVFQFSESYFTLIKSVVNVSYFSLLISFSPLRQYHLQALLTSLASLKGGRKLQLNSISFTGYVVRSLINSANCHFTDLWRSD